MSFPPAGWSDVQQPLFECFSDKEKKKIKEEYKRPQNPREIG